eukprot:3284221-Prymnesium_polylepis.1
MQSLRSSRAAPVTPSNAASLVCFVTAFFACVSACALRTGSITSAHHMPLPLPRARTAQPETA